MVRLLAIAGMTIRAALRMRLFWILAALLAAVCFLLPPTLRDDGTAAGRVTIVLTYLLQGSRAVLCLATVWLAADSLGNELHRRHIHLLATKPVGRWRIWAGKWLGLMALNTALLVMVGAAALVQIEAIGRRFPGREVAPPAHRVWRAEVPDFAELPEPERREALAAWQSVAPGETQTWRFGLMVRPDAPVELRSRFRSAGPLPEGGAAGEWTITDENGQRRERGLYRPDAVERLEWRFAEQPGEVTATFLNRSDQTLVFPVADRPAFWCRVGGFRGNLARALVVQWLELGFLGALGLAVGAGLSFPVAAFVLVAYLVVAAHVPLVAGLLGQGVRLAGHDRGAGLGPVTRLTVALGVWLTDPLHRYGGTGELVRGIHLDARRLLAALWELGLLRTGAVTLVGLLIWQRRELAGESQ